MSSGVYILKTKDGYRVNFSFRYYDFFDGFNDSGYSYKPNAKTLEEVFGFCTCYPTRESALLKAASISKNLEYETFDGIMFIENFKDMTFGELINGKS